MAYYIYEKRGVKMVAEEDANLDITWIVKEGPFETRELAEQAAGMTFEESTPTIDIDWGGWSIESGPIPENDMISVEEYTELAGRAFAGDADAAVKLIPEAVKRGDAYDPDAVIAWVVARGPINMAEGAEGEGSLNFEMQYLIDTYGAFKHPEAILTQIQASKTAKDLVEWQGKLYAASLAPEEAKKALGIDEPEAEAEKAEGIGDTITKYVKESRVLPVALGILGVALIGRGIYKLVVRD